MSRFQFSLILAALSFVAGGCNALPAGSVEAARAESALDRRGEAYLLRGWRGLWSEGIDGLARELAAEGVDAHAYREDQAAALGDALVERYRSAARPEPLVLIGFSFGADQAIRVAQKLADAGVGVDLLVTLDPVTPPRAPGRVRRTLNYYQSNGAWDVLPWLRGVPVDVAGDTGTATPLANVNLRDRADLAESDVSHRTIAADAKLHRAIVADVLRACPPRGEVRREMRGATGAPPSREDR